MTVPIPTRVWSLESTHWKLLTGGYSLEATHWRLLTKRFRSMLIAPFRALTKAKLIFELQDFQIPGEITKKQNYSSLPTLSGQKRSEHSPSVRQSEESV